MKSKLHSRSMTSPEFVEWLKGKFDRKRGKPFSKKEREEILVELHKVYDPPGTQPWEEIYPIPMFPVVDDSRCPVCNLELTGVMGYVCPNTDCPTGLGPTIVSASTTSLE